MKVLVLFSGGLDSILAIKLLQEKGYRVTAFHFTSPFISEKTNIKELTKKLGVKLITKKADSKYFNLIRHPKHGYGSAINPCIDCRIYILKQAKNIADKLNIKLIATGEVLGERPMTQNKKALELIEKEAGLKGRLLRPLSSELLPKIVDDKFESIEGRTRKRQLELAKKYKLINFPTPAGGCLLTQKEYVPRLKDLFKYNKKLNEKDIQLLKLGRHFRYKHSKIIVGRNEKENKELLKFKRDYYFEVSDIGSPITLLFGTAIEFAAKLTARYSDAKGKKISVRYGKEKLNKNILVSPAKQEEIDKYIL